MKQFNTSTAVTEEIITLHAQLQSLQSIRNELEAQEAQEAFELQEAQEAHSHTMEDIIDILTNELDCDVRDHCDIDDIQNPMDVIDHGESIIKQLPFDSRTVAREAMKSFNSRLIDLLGDYPTYDEEDGTEVDEDIIEELQDAFIQLCGIINGLSSCDVNEPENEPQEDTQEVDTEEVEVEKEAEKEVEKEVDTEYNSKRVVDVLPGQLVTIGDVTLEQREAEAEMDLDEEGLNDDTFRHDQSAEYYRLAGTRLWESFKAVREISDIKGNQFVQYKSHIKTLETNLNDLEVDNARISAELSSTIRSLVKTEKQLEELNSTKKNRSTGSTKSNAKLKKAKVKGYLFPKKT